MIWLKHWRRCRQDVLKELEVNSIWNTINYKLIKYSFLEGISQRALDFDYSSDIHVPMKTAAAKKQIEKMDSESEITGNRFADNMGEHSKVTKESVKPIMYWILNMSIFLNFQSIRKRHQTIPDENDEQSKKSKSDEADPMIKKMEACNY